MADPGTLISCVTIRGRNERVSRTRGTSNPTFSGRRKKMNMLTRSCRTHPLSRHPCCSTAAGKLCRWCRTLLPRKAGRTVGIIAAGKGREGGILQREKKNRTIVQIFLGNERLQKQWYVLYNVAYIMCVCVFFLGLFWGGGEE